MYVFQGGYTPTRFRTCSADWARHAILLDGGGSSPSCCGATPAGMWAGAGVPRGPGDTMQVPCDSHERIAGLAGLLNQGGPPVQRKTRPPKSVRSTI